MQISCSHSLHIVTVLSQFSFTIKKMAALNVTSLKKPTYIVLPKNCFFELECLAENSIAFTKVFMTKLRG